jgi:diguanylate cyclase (GGDEF)-like protein/PAS domain S-box-containing protein
MSPDPKLPNAKNKSPDLLDFDDCALAIKITVVLTGLVGTAMNAKIVIHSTTGLGKIDVPEALKPWFEERQIENHYDGIFAVHVTQLMMLALLGMSAAGNFSGLFVAMLAMGALLIVAPMYFGALAFKRPTVERNRGVLMRHIELQAIVAGGCWGALLAAHILLAGSEHMLFGLLIAVIFMVGGITYGSVSAAPRQFLFPASAGAALGYLADGKVQSLWAAGFILIFAYLLNESIKTLFASFASRLIRSRELQQAVDTVQLVLNDYEEQGADWLWEVDVKGMIVDPSERFQGAAGMSCDKLSGEFLLTLFETSEGRELIADSLARQVPFRDASVSLISGDGQKWWRLSGRPHIDEVGKFSGMRGVATDISAAKNAEAKVAYLAHYDSLTNLPNRRLFNETVERAISRCTEHGPLAVLYLDLDHFKIINDSFGHGVGDQVLITAATRIEIVVGSKNMVSRLGGDEFAILLPRIASVEEALDIARRVTTALAEPITINGQVIQSGASVGVAIAPADAACAEELIKNADLALYDAKIGDRGSVSVFHVRMQDAMEAKRLVEIDLRAALAAGQLELYYQPLVNVTTTEVVGYEALLRWHHPQHGLIMPDHFIPIAEETGLIVPVGEWVIRSALDEVRHWPDHLSVSVNLSPAQLRSPNLIPTVINALAATGVTPARLEMEITETVLMQDSEANLAIMHKLREVGVRIALDDFGTGYSSLNYLRSFPFDKIKIDRCFVEDVVNREDCKAIVRAVTGLANSLGMTTTAEGVERSEQLDQLKRDGCSEAQGYLFSKAIPASAIANRLQEAAKTANAVASIEGHACHGVRSSGHQSVRKAS